ncbi:MAG: zinc-dependent alcohol dehydrogenase family protein [Thermoflavifilum sp.]|nr:zinc-dependent alcohol dehydrogenase family protein [Thermoflavifilum sp.]MCL6513856.1 zinc-dependent alcohol dehydrogenase family protein [Alicyclobacillus sp.]
MQALVLEDVGVLRLKTVADPAPGPGEVLLRVAACGICGTDVHIFQGSPGSAPVAPPVVLGHELAGEVIEVGAGVQELRVGDRVAVDPNIYCGRCRFCRDGRPQMCEHLQAVGVTRNGGMAELCVVPAASCHRLPEGASWLDGALAEPLACCLHGIERLAPRAGQRALVIGAGFIGLVMVQLLRMYGAGPIVVSEPDPKKREMALSLGADSAFHPYAVSRDGAGVPAAHMDEGFDLVVECVGRQETMQAAVDAAGRGARVLMFGVAHPAAEIRLHPYEVFAKELTILGSFINPHTHRAAVALVAQQRLRLQALVSHRFTPTQVAEALPQYSQLGIRKGVLVWPWAAEDKRG